MSKLNYILFLLIVANWQSVATNYEVSSNDQLKDIVSSLLPGDTVKFQAGTWMDEDIDFAGEGSENNPIVFVGAEGGQTIFSGNTHGNISGNYLVVQDFVFKDGVLTESGSILEFRDGSKLAHNCRVSNVTIQDYNPADKKVDSKYLSIYGTYNRVDHCSFAGKTNSGATFVVWLDETPDYHLIDHNYFGPRPDLGVNGGETIRIGTSDWERHSSNCTVEYNLFDECDGEIEIISNKSVGNHYRYNTFDNCEGTLTLRHGSDCWVYGNFFFGNEEKNCGGIRIIGPGHVVFNNYLENLTGTSYRAAICLMNGVPNSPANRYRQVDNALVGFNTIINCKEPFAIGAGVDSEKTLAPSNSRIENNLVISKDGREVVKDYASAIGVTWKAIYTDASDIGITAGGFVKTELPMTQDGYLLRPDTENPAIGASLAGAFDTISVDIDGQARPETLKDVGCDQVSYSPKTIHPLTKEEVGANYDVPTYSPFLEISKPKILLNNGVLKVNFEDEGKRTVSMFSIEGKLLSTTQVNTQSFKQRISHFPRLFIVEVRDAHSKYSVKLIQ